MATPAVATIPTPPPMSYGVEPDEDHQKDEQNRRLRDWLRRLKRNEQRTPSNESQIPVTPPQTPDARRPSLGQRWSKRVGVGLPRSTTFKRQQDEQRTNLEPHRPTIGERRTSSSARARALSASPKPFKKRPRRETSAPDLGYHAEAYPSIAARIEAPYATAAESENPSQVPPPPPPPPSRPAPVDDDAASDRSYDTSGTLAAEIKYELETKWILNLSMHFRDKSPREKFFVTYAETPKKWRRVTVSCDYRNAEVDSLEADLRTMASQREKSARIYESLRGSLEDIQFYDTVTNLKLETREERLHVHVTEDLNEIISYPPSHSFDHLQKVRRYRESELHFVEHMSGFVYKVSVGGHTWIKKEIPGPDSVDEFQYEVNALANLVNASHVIELKGLVVSDNGATVKGLLIAYAEKNAMVDIIYDNKDNLPWPRRERWARQIIKGLAEIHEAGFVQGDFTLSNIVVDGKDEARIIDINRRGCPVGWEPPEIAQLIASGQRISMFLGVKSDLFQLGMVLWALAMEDDEPEKQGPPLSLDNGPEEIPGYFRGLVSRCLSSDPVMRLSAKDLLKEFPASVVVSKSFEKNMPEVKPGTSPPSVPIIKASAHRAGPDIPEDDFSRVDAPTEITRDAGSQFSSFENIDSSEPTYTAMLSRTAESTERLYNGATEPSAAHLQTPDFHGNSSSIEPQPSDPSPGQSSNSLPQQATTDVHSNGAEETPAEPIPIHRTSSPPQTSRGYTALGPDTIPLEPLDTWDRTPSSWDAITGATASPYEVPLSALDPLTEPSTPFSEQRRAGHFETSDYGFTDRRRPSQGLRGIPSPPPHVDSGLADMDDEIPHQHQDLQQESAQESPPLRGTHSPKSPNSYQQTRLQRSTSTIQRIDTSEPSKAPPPTSSSPRTAHPDFGVADTSPTNTSPLQASGPGGGSEGLSFKARAHRSGVFSRGVLGEEIERMMTAASGGGDGTTSVNNEGAEGAEKRRSAGEARQNAVPGGVEMAMQRKADDE